MSARNKSYWNALLITGFKILQATWVDLVDSFMIREPATQPAISGGVLALDCGNAQEVIFEPRLSIPDRTIDTNFTIAFSNITGTLVPHCIFEFTGTLIITMPSNVKCSNPSSIGVWTPGATPTLELATGVDDNVEFSFIKDKTSGDFNLIVSEIAL